jgi:hypothetical protein
MNNDLIGAILLILIYAIVLFCLPLMKKSARDKIARLDGSCFKKALNRSQWVPFSLTEPAARLDIYDTEYPPPYAASRLGFLRDIRSAGGLGILAAIAWLILIPIIIVMMFLIPSAKRSTVFELILAVIAASATGAATLYEFYCLFRLYAIRDRVLKRKEVERA